MTLDEFVFTRDDITRCQGFEEGLEEGREEGADRMAVLCSALVAANRADDILRVTKDKGYRESLFKEFGLSHSASGAG